MEMEEASPATEDGLEQYNLRKEVDAACGLKCTFIRQLIVGFSSL